ncbi:VOC family protein [Natronospirillum operosum]|uniref:VOC family protein n=1 Tax=Natronospirillum operosum TaxID=2759953 RepID=A0A4Z0WFP9_9GAMM|nr:VOC family protein [Natronospirillum operosum]TGG95438.1 VOC family protein [Natronospirillum operosum]
MEKVTGIGGLFFKAENPAELSRWYQDNLGVFMPPASYDQEPWRQEAGPTIFAPMSSGSSHFKVGAQLSVNFRVADLDRMCTQLTDAGISVTVDPEVYPNGRFASLEDPEGNQIQLWESGP